MLPTTRPRSVSPQFVNGSQWAMRQAFLEGKNFIKSAPEITVWAGQRFYDRHDIYIHDLFFDDYSGYGMGVDNIDLGFGKFEMAYLGGSRDAINNEGFAQINGLLTLNTGPGGVVTSGKMRTRVACTCTPSTSEFMISISSAANSSLLL